MSTELVGLRAYYEAHGYEPIVNLSQEGYEGPTHVQMEKVLEEPRTRRKGTGDDGSDVTARSRER